MKCYYDVLGVARDANDEELKKTYKKLALKWHPDKNVGDEETAKENFLLVQQAFEVLIDPHERAWYDNHREAILKGGLGSNYNDDSLDILPYFSASCYKGFSDDAKGFYAVYSEVFKKLAAEDSEYMKEDDPEIPSFGRSDSSYEEVVAPFYSYWMFYSTKKNYYWLDPHDTRQAPNHKIAKLIEKENKKVRDKAKKERNEEVRNLVAFVKKRDKRVQAWNKQLEDKAKENQKKSEQNRLQKLKEKRNLMENYKESEWLKFSNVENDLKQIEENLAKEFGDVHSSSENENSQECNSGNSFFCVACNKVFKTEKSFANHENSKKHKENVSLLKEKITEEDIALNLTGENVEELNKSDDSNSVLNTVETKQEKKKMKKSRQKKPSNVININEYSESDDSSVDMNHILSFQSKKLRNRNMVNNNVAHEEMEKKSKKKNKKATKTLDSNQKKAESDCDELPSAMNSLMLHNVEKGEKIKETKKNRGNQFSQEKVVESNLTCAVCKNQYPSKNKLFNHLKSTGHSVYLPNSATAKKEGTRKHKY